MKKRTPEGAVLRAVLDLLAVERVWHMRCQTGMQVLEGPHGSRRVFRAGRPGMADVLALVQVPVCCGPSFRSGPCGRCAACGKSPDALCIPVWIECKAQRGRQSPIQRQFQAEVEAERHVYLLVRDVAELQRWLKEAR